MTRKKKNETENRLLAALCDEPVPGIDLQEHARLIAADVARRRQAAQVAEAKRAAAREADLAEHLRQQVRKSA